MPINFELVPMTPPEAQQELVPFEGGVSGNIAEPLQPAPQPPPFVGSFENALKDIEDSGEPGWANEGAPEMTEQSATAFERIETEADKLNDEKSTYMLQQMWRRSLTGSIYRGTFDAEINQEMENQLEFQDKLMIAAGTLGPDIWLFGMGAAIPVASGAVKAMPLIARPVQAASSFGFFEGIRRTYMNAVLEKGDPGKLEFLDLLGESLYETAKGSAIGATLGAGQQFRHKLFSEASSVLTGTAKAGSFLAAEATAVATLMSQMHNPGVLPTQEEFALSLALIFGFEGMGMANHAMSRTVRDASFMLRRIDEAKMREAEGWRNIRGSLRPVKPGEKWTPEKEARYEHTPAAKVITAYERNGVHPMELAKMAEKDITIKEDLINPLTDKIRALEIEGGLPPEPPKIVTEIKANYRNARLGLQPTSDLVPQQATGQPGQPQQTLSGPASPPVRLQTPGIHQPIQIYVGEPTEMVTLPSGQQVMIPADRSRSLALSEDGLISSPMAIALALEVAPGIQIRAASEGIDPEFKKYPGRVGGYFSQAEIARNERIQGLEKSIRAGDATVRGMRRQMRHDDVLLEQRRLDGMNTELARLKSADLESKESAIVINRMLGDTSHGRQLMTILHEVGHLLSFMNEGWEQIAPHQGLYLGKTVGSSSLFYNTLSGYPGIIRGVFEFAQQNNLSYPAIKAEGQFLSRLWRLTSNEAQFTQDSYRQSGSELIADIVSVSLHRPDILQQYTPNLLKAMELFYEARPEVKARVEDMNKMIAEGRSWEYSSHALQSGFMRAEAVARKTRDDSSGQAKQRMADLATRVQAEALDKYQALWNKIADDSLRLTNTVQKLQFKTTIKEGYVRRMATEVMKPLQDVGMTEYDAGELLVYRRILQDPGRSELFNVIGFTPKDALEGFNRLTQLYGNDPRIFQALDAVHDIRMKGPIALLRKYGLVGDDYLNLLESNFAYARFDDLSYYIADLEKGYSSGDRVKQGQVLSDAEGKILKQKGALGLIRNPLTATIERDLKLYDTILKTAAIKEMITALIRENNVPIFRKERFEDLARNQPHMLKNYVKADFVTMSYPQRRLNPKTGKYHTVRTEYMVPKILSDAFEAAPNAIQRFVGEVSNTPWSSVLRDMVARDKGFGLTPRVLAPLAKAIQTSNDFARAMMITFGGSFLAANLVSYDLIRTFVQLPRTNESTPFSGKAAYPIEYFASLKDLFLWQFKGKMHDHIAYLMDEGLIVTGRRWTEDADNATLLSQIQGAYGGLGYQAKIWQPLSLTLGNLATQANEAMRRLLTASDSASKLSAYRHLKKGMAEGKYPHVTEDMLQVVIREQVGSPAYAIKGNMATALNMYSLFYSSIMSATRGDFRAAKRNPTMFVAEWATFLVPTTLMAMLAMGLFEGAMDALFDDDEEGIGTMNEVLGMAGIDPTSLTSYAPSQILATRTQLEKKGNWVIPLGMNDDGEGSVITFPLPQGAPFFVLHNTTLVLLEAAHMAWKQDNSDKEAKEVLKGYVGLLMDGIKGTIEAMEKTQERAIPQAAPWRYAGGRAYDILMRGNTASRMHDGKEFGTDAQKGERVAAAAKTATKDFGVPKSIRTAFDDDGMLDSMQELFHPSAGTNDSLATRSANVAANLPLVGDMYGRFFRTGNPGLTERIFLREAEARAETARKRGVADKMVAGESLSEEDMSEVIGRDQLLNAAKEAGVKAMDNKYLELLVKKGKHAYPDVLDAASNGVPKAQIALGLYHSSGRKIPDLQEVKK